MATVLLSTLALFASSSITPVASLPFKPSHLNVRSNDGRPCTSFTLPVPIVSHQHTYDYLHVDSNIDATSWEVDLGTWNSRPASERILGNITISKTYNIYATLCVPPEGAKKNLLQIATHGGGFDGRYWDSEIEPEKYSFVTAALEAGYSILFYDRLDTGKSDHPDAYTEGQLDAAVQILRSITEIVRDGKLSSYASCAISWEKIIHVGHSLGSFTTYAMTSEYPELSDAVILTGYVPSNGSAPGAISTQDYAYARELDPELFADFGSGYVVSGTKTAIQAGFLSTKVDKATGLGGFDPKLLDYAFSIRQPVTATETGTGAALLVNHPTAPGFTGPVLFTTGEFDYGICGGDCKGTFSQELLETIYPSAKDVKSYLQPGTGHGMPWHYGAREGVQVMFDWLAENGF